MSCDFWKPLLSGYLDSELTREEEEKLKNHLSHCAECRMELSELRHVEGVTQAMKHETVPDVVWDTYWLSIYNRLERGLAWVLLSIGGAILLSYALWHFATAFLLTPEVPLVLRVGTGVLVFGLAFLTVGVVRERIQIWRQDPYREVKR